jgi:hypothetical protein
MEIKGNRFYRNSFGQYVFVKSVRTVVGNGKELLSLSILQPKNIVEEANWNNMEIVEFEEIMDLLNAKDEEESNANHNQV